MVFFCTQIKYGKSSSKPMLPEATGSNSIGRESPSLTAPNRVSGPVHSWSYISAVRTKAVPSRYWVKVCLTNFKP